MSSILLSLSREDEWTACLPAFLYSLFDCCLALAFTLALAHMRVRVQTETFRTAGIYYKPNKRIRHLVYELLAFPKATKAPIFIEAQETQFSFQLHLITRAKTIQKASLVTTSRFIHSFIHSSFIQRH